MKRLTTILAVLLVAFAPTSPILSVAHAEATKALFIREIKITGEEFVVLESASDIPNLSEYWLSYSSSETATNIVPSQQLPAIALGAGQSILLTSDGASTCDSLWTTKLTPTLGDTRGALEVRRLQSFGSQSTFSTVDAVNWAKPAASGSTTALLDLRMQPVVATTPVWYQDVTLPKWHIGQLDGCVLSIFGSTPQAPITQIEWVVAQEEPLAIIESVSDDQLVTEENVVVETNRNPGLAAPQITELLANPPGTGTDDTEEFIELYNSNDAELDLSGFVLRTGTSTTHDYTFPNNTKLAGKSFGAFYANQTALTLSNTGSRAILLDPFGAQVSVTDDYTSAKDGMSWALAQGQWYWTNRPTPGSTNIIVQVAPSQLAKATTTKSVLGAAKTKKATTTKAKAKAKVKVAKAKSSESKSKSNSVASAALRPAGIHTGVLALAAVAGVGYGLYGYRHDIANKFYNFKSNRAARRKVGK